MTENDEYKLALDSVTSSIEVNPDDPENYRRLGDLYFGAFKLELAAGAYEQAIELNPADALAYKNLGFVYHLSGMIGKPGAYEKSIEAFKEATGLVPDDAEAHYGLGINYNSLEMHEYAYEKYLLLKRMDGKCADNLLEDIERYSSEVHKSYTEQEHAE